MKPVISMSSVVALLFLELLALAAINICLCHGSTHVGCIESERRALLRLKKDLKDPSNRLASWNGDGGDCCNWAAVVCHNFTSHVLELHLGNPHLIRYYSTSSDGLYQSDMVREAEYEAFSRSKLVGKLNPSLLDFKQLIYLNLSGNHFDGIKIPTYLGSLRNLKYLDLSYAGFMGMIPHQLGNLSDLQHLDLRNNFQQLYVDNLSWLSSLSSLKHLDLSEAQLANASDWLTVVNSLPSLVELRLSGCELLYFLPLPIANLSYLVTLDLSDNYHFHTPLIFSWIFGLKNVVFIDLSFNNFEGPIPDGFQNLTSLEHFDLSYNNFNLSIPDGLHRFSHLRFLSLRQNNLTGTVSSAISNLTSIERLDLSENKLLQWRIPRSFGRLCNLRSIILSGVRLSREISEILNILSGCISNGLESMNLKNTQLSGHLTNQLVQFKSLDSLSLSHNSISGSIPPSLGEISSLAFLDLSSNNLTGEFSQAHFVNLTRLSVFSISGNSLTLKFNHDWVPPFQLDELGLRSCTLGSQFPSWLHSQKRLIYLDISNTGISDTIPGNFWKSHSQLLYLNLSRNQIFGEIPTLATQLDILDFSSNNLSGSLPTISSYVRVLDLSNNAFSGSIFQFLCSQMNESKSLGVLNLRNNSLSGRLPNCWMSWSELYILNLANNEFTGSLPTSMSSLHNLFSLHLGKNSFSGMIPMSLKNCTQLQALDIGGNEFVGNVPTWIGETFSSMKILSFHSNKFHGFLPVELCYLVYIQILDLSHNNIYGPIPRCIGNFSAMGSMGYFGENSIRYIGYIYSDFENKMFIEEASLVMKGTVADYNTILNLVRYIDLSHNNFSGEIPTEVTSLGALQSLNLSHNSFTGKIPSSIGAMRALESIDLSTNKFDGEIPQSISNLTFLSFLNFSNNNLIGKIPSSTQLQSFDASSFTGNKLCGPPLPKNCTEIVPTPGSETRNEDEVDWLFYVSIAVGFIVGFWSVIGSLLVNRRWRYMYYHFLDCLGDKLGSVVRKCC